MSYWRLTLPACLLMNVSMFRHHLPEPLPAAEQMLTSAECEALAASFKDLPPEYQLTAAEAEQLEEQLHGKPLRYGEPGAAGLAMKQRLLVLLAQKAQALATMDDCDEGLFASLTADVADLNRQIAETRSRLDDYHRQQGTAN